MDLVSKSELIAENSSLSFREAAALLFEREYNSIADTRSSMKQYLDDVPSESTIRSQKAVGRKKLSQSCIGYGLLTGDFSNIYVPSRPIKKNNLGVYVYTGGVGVGKTITAQTHALRLQRQNKMGDVLIFDPISEGWGVVADKINDVNIISDPNQIKRGISKLEKNLVELDGTMEKPATIFIEQFHLIQNDFPGIVDNLANTKTPIEIRIICQTISSIINKTEIDLMYIHPTKDSEVSGYINQKYDVDMTLYQPLESIVENLSQTPEGVPDVLVYNPQTGERIIRPNILTNEEKDILK